MYHSQVHFYGRSSLKKEKRVAEECPKFEVNNHPLKVVTVSIVSSFSYLLFIRMLGNKLHSCGDILHY